MLRRAIPLGITGVAMACLAWLAAPASEAAESGRASPEAAGRGTDTAEVLVSPRRIPGLFMDADEYPGHATVLTRTAIERSGAQTVPELLARQAGMHLLDQQGFGLAADGGVNIRGVINSSRTGALVLVDGVRQNRFTGDEMHWQSVPLDHVERIEIIRGGGGATYGEGAMAGVINIITRQDGDRPVETGYRLETGTFGFRRAHAGARGRGGPWTYAVQGTRTLLDGYRESSWSRGSVVNAHAGVELAPGLTSRLHVLHSEDVTAFPGNLTQAQSQQRREGTNSFHGFNTNEDDQVSLDVIAGPAQGLSGVLTAYWRRRTQFSQDSINFNSFTVTPSHGLNLHGNYEAEGESVRSLLVGGLELLNDKATAGDPGAGEDSQSHRRGYGVFVEESLTLWDRLTLTGGARIDKSRYEESLTFPSFTGSLRFEGWSPKLAATYAIVPEALFAFASFARPYKAPNVDDFSVRTVDFTANPNLQAQQAESSEVGLRGARNGWDGAATWFLTRTKNEILVNPFAFQSQNFNTLRIGGELAAGYTGERVRARTSYLFVDAEFRGGEFNENTIPGTPEHTVNVQCEVSPVDRLWLQASFRAVHDFLNINDLRNALNHGDNYGVLDLMARYEFPAPNPWGPGEAYLKVLNATNEEYETFQSSNGTNMLGAGEAPMPPLGIVAGVRWEW